MNIPKINDAARIPYSTPAKTATEESQKKNSTMAADNTDKIDTQNTAAYSGTYSKPANKTDYNAVDRNGFNAKGSARQMKNEAVRGMVQAQINGQVNKGGYKPLFGGNQTVLDAMKAAEASSEKYDDYWSVDATADRIFTFAKTLAGDDEKMFQTMKDAFLKGFKQAEGAWSGAGGGKLPSVSYQTKDKVLSLFDEWEKEINAKKETVAKSDAKAEVKADEKKAEEAKSNAAATAAKPKEPIPYVGAAKYGTTPAPTTYSKGEKIAYIGDEKYGESFKNDFDVNGYVRPEDKK
ncbi:MAG: hypothetical protein FWG44_08935 [Oscillospiraceae bacterium]|nr:hypothetical protein [Oscillospiraceae bacterium]